LSKIERRKRLRRKLRKMLLS